MRSLAAISKEIPADSSPAATFDTSGSVGGTTEVQVYVATRSPVSHSIKLNQVLGVGSFGKVYAGGW